MVKYLLCAGCCANHTATSISFNVHTHSDRDVVISVLPVRRVSVGEAGGGILFFKYYIFLLFFGLHQALDAAGELLIMAGGV